MRLSTFWINGRGQCFHRGRGLSAQPYFIGDNGADLLVCTLRIRKSLSDHELTK